MANGFLVTTALFYALQAMGSLAAPAAPPIWELDPLIQRVVDIDPTFYDRFIVTGKVDGVNGLPLPAEHRNAPHIVYPQVVHSEEEYNAFQAAKNGPTNAKRGTPRPLWNQQLGPRYTDVKQAQFGDCWLDSALLSLAWVNPLQWIQTVFTLPVPGNPTTDHTLVTLHTEPSITTWNSTIDGIFSIPSIGKKYSDASSLWWPSAVEYAVQQYGVSTGEPNILNVGGWPATSLKWLTNYPTTDIIVRESDLNTIFKQLQYASRSPVLFGTERLTKTLVSRHAYAVLWAGYGNPSGSPGESDSTTPTVLLQNPWGFTLFYNLKDILPDIYIFTYLTNHQNGPGQ